MEADARVLEAAYQKRFEEAALPDINLADQRLVSAVRWPLPKDPPSETPSDVHATANAPPGEKFGLAFPKEPPRRRSKDHLAFIRSQGDAHHLKFAQPRTLGRKVSDEFTVPLCRSHHQSLHRHGNERACWTNLRISPLPIAKALWDASPVHQTDGASLSVSAQVRSRRCNGNEHSKRPTSAAMLATLPSQFEALCPSPQLLPGENIDHFHALQAEIFRDINPRCAIEWLLAIDIAELS
ncbi:hypothetical protein ABIA00_002170 [Bradyrhizobium ottawaense]|uniref:hypothetical protein n=1 Tax=Bradyrhizobium ottawaense TaxID=931866 RepID=UPI0038352BD3